MENKGTVDLQQVRLNTHATPSSSLTPLSYNQFLPSEHEVVSAVECVDGQFLMAIAKGSPREAAVLLVKVRRVHKKEGREKKRKTHKSNLFLCSCKREGCSFNWQCL